VTGPEQYPTPPPYGPPPAYGPPPGYGPPAYGPPPGYGSGVPPWPVPPVQRPWPYGDGRPAMATAAGVLGIVTGGLTALACLMWLFGTISGDGSSAVMLICGIPCAVGTLTGGIRLLQGHRRGLLLGSAVLSVVVLLLTLAIGVLTSDDSEQTVGVTVFVVLALALPVVTAALTAQRSVQGWTEGLPPR
jgi:hypothetical protein